MDHFNNIVVRGKVRDVPGRVVKAYGGNRKYRIADKSLARLGRKQAASVKSMMDRGMD